MKKENPRIQLLQEQHGVIMIMIRTIWLDYIILDRKANDLLKKDYY